MDAFDRFKEFGVELVCLFREPGAKESRELRSQLLKLGIRSEGCELFGPESLALKANLDDMLGHLKQMLQDDYERNVAECSEWCGDFETGIGFDDGAPHGLCIYTRLFPHIDVSRGIMYMSRIERIEENEYWLWDAHTER